VDDESKGAQVEVYGSNGSLVVELGAGRVSGNGYVSALSASDISTQVVLGVNATSGNGLFEIDTKGKKAVEITTGTLRHDGITNLEPFRR